MSAVRRSVTGPRDRNLQERVWLSSCRHVVLWSLLAAGGGLCGPVRATEPRLGLSQDVSGRSFLYRSDPSYLNYGFEDYTLPEFTSFTRRNYYGPLGNFLIQGYDVYEWRETRSSATTAWHKSLRTIPRWGRFERNLVARESHARWAASLIYGEEIRTLFTPLTLALPGYDGIRLDSQVGNARGAVIGQRYTGHFTAGRYGEGPVWTDWDFTEHRRSSLMLLGAHGDVELGALTLGATGVNFHIFDAEQERFVLRGGLQAEQVLPVAYLVRFSDDSPEDLQAGAVVSEVRLKINGENRPDLRPFLARINGQNPTAVGSTNRLTGQFRRVAYLDRGTRFADVLYLRGHLQGDDVSDKVNLEELLRWVEALPDVPGLRADGHEQIIAVFDVSQEPFIRQVQVEALVGNDYRVEVLPLFVSAPAVENYEFHYRVGGNALVPGQGYFVERETPGVTAARRSRGNVQDMSNLEWVRLDLGEWTGRALWGLDGAWEWGDAEVRWEYARSMEYREFPDGRPGYRQDREVRGIRRWNGARSSTGAGAWYVNGQWRRGRMEVGGELFSIAEEYDSGFVQDNDDDDRYPDIGPGHRPMSADTGTPFDPDGVFPGNDRDNDRIPDTNRNGNRVPDYLEAFLLYDVEPLAYAYGRDANNNGIADHREDDLDSDYPYEVDQRGHHVFGTLHLPGGFRLTAGRLQAGGIVGGGRNESTYGVAHFRRHSPRWGSVRAETRLRRLHDDIVDNYVVFDEAWGRYPNRERTYAPTTMLDLLEYRDSLDRQHYVEADLTAGRGLRLGGNLRYAVNEQQEATLADGSDQAADTITRLTLVARAEYVWELSDRWQLIAQTKGLVLRRTRQSLAVDLANEWTFIPILKTSYHITPRTHLWLGTQGLPGLPLRKEDLADGRDSYEEVVRVVQLTNWSPYFGYDIATNLGVKWSRRQYGDPARERDDLDITSAFMRVILGFEE